MIQAKVSKLVESVAYGVTEDLMEALMDNEENLMVNNLLHLAITHGRRDAAKGGGVRRQRRGGQRAMETRTSEESRMYKCYNCNGNGHTARHCPVTIKRDEKMCYGCKTIMKADDPERHKASCTQSTAGKQKITTEEEDKEEIARICKRRGWTTEEVSDDGSDSE